MSDLRQSNRRAWDEWSDDFQAIWRSDTDEGELPPAPSPFAEDAPGGPQPQILESVEGKSYVELGCGGGQGSVGTAELGADPVVGVDFSGEQLRYARQLRDEYGVDESHRLSSAIEGLRPSGNRKPTASGDNQNASRSGDVDARFVQGDVTDLPLPDDRFDVASSEAAFQMVEDVDRAFAEAHRVLREGGVFVFSVMHPLNEALDPETGTLAESYVDPGPREIVIDENYEETLTVFDRTVADLHNGLVDAGFEVRRLLEHHNHEVEHNDPEESDKPDVLWKVPQSVRFWAIAR
ncbi:class I SAM-dependent methyltransferase [Halolamina sp. CBA1230]|uniref:class I SAM-dependent methyltransferase n=1 Tax=Halolamina sp. CBA1230 TaxID=1853690 RepID=UPI0009A1ED3C|nr:class I SAM-dependent methyltransferase [Halolamina sp. CBA1230]QKY19388.1 class I SAM-dependent methyltransferase [Halolamina sp. CBA1230]